MTAADVQTRRARAEAALEAAWAAYAVASREIAASMEGADGDLWAEKVRGHMRDMGWSFEELGRLLRQLEAS